MADLRRRLCLGAATVLVIGLALSVTSYDPGPPKKGASSAITSIPDAAAPAQRTEGGIPEPGADEWEPTLRSPAPRGGSARIEVRVEPTPADPDAVPVAVLWSFDATRHRAAETGLRLDAQGLAGLELQPPRGADDPGADFAFPTDGSSARPVPQDGSRAVLPLPPLGVFAIEVKEADGSSLRERARVRLRVPRADPPGDRWHFLDLREGRGELPAQACGLDLLVEVRTASGRTASRQAQGPTVAGMRSACTLLLPPGRALSTRILTPHGLALPETDLEVLRTTDWSAATGYRLRTDAAGWLVLHLPEYLQRSDEPLELVVRADLPVGLHHALLLLSPVVLARGGELDPLVLAPTPPLVAGTVVGPRGNALGDTEVLLEVEPAGPSGLAGSREWIRLAATRSGADGTFTFRHFAPAQRRLRLRVGGFGARRAESMIVEAGDLAVRFTVGSD